MSSDSDFSVLILASDLGIDGRSLLTPDTEVFHDCPSSPTDFSDLDSLRFLRISAGHTKSNLPILQIIGKHFPATVVSGERLRRYLRFKLLELPGDGSFCVVYMHTGVRTGDNNPGMGVLRWVYEEMGEEFKERLEVVYVLHPGLRARVVMATLGRMLLSGGLYWKIKYVSRLQYLWDEIKKGQVEIPEFVQEHDEVLEYRPLTDYGIEPDPLYLTRVPAMDYSLGRYEDRWTSRAYM